MNATLYARRHCRNCKQQNLYARATWPGFATITDVATARQIGRTAGPALAMTIVRTVALGTCRHI